MKESHRNTEHIPIDIKDERSTNEIKKESRKALHSELKKIEQSVIIPFKPIEMPRSRLSPYKNHDRHRSRGNCKKSASARIN